jgi:hypothetical protein
MGTGSVMVCTQLSHVWNYIQTFVKTYKVPVVRKVSTESVGRERKEDGGYGGELSYDYRAEGDERNAFFVRSAHTNVMLRRTGKVGCEQATPVKSLVVLALCL